MAHRKASLLVLLSITLCFSASHGAEGIYVQPAKHFDERSLMIMLDDLARQLEAVQVIDQAKLEAQLGISSGTIRRTSGLSVNLGGPALPGIVTKSTINSLGVLAPSEQTVTQAGTTPTVPALPTMSPLVGIPTPGVNSEAMLSEQVNLTYRLYALRTLLNRSLSDRVFIKNPEALRDSGVLTVAARKQVLMGFSIDIQPPKNAEDKEAYVRIDISRVGGRLPSVVALMPQEKVFNVATVSEKANSFGFAIPVSVLTLGQSVGSQNQALFVYRDTDTIGRLDPPLVGGQGDAQKPESTSFGWTFRPVLGRKWVEPGNRKVFVTLSLDGEDDPNVTTEMSYSVTTGWRKLKDKMAIDTAGESGVPEKGTVVIYGDRVIRKALEPSVHKATVSPLNDTAALVTFEGKNFFPGTQVAVGDKLIAEQSAGITIPSNEALTFATKLDDLESGFASVFGRYGLPVPVTVDPQKDYKMGLRLSLVAKPDPARDLVPVQLGVRECKDRQAATDCKIPTWIRDENLTLLISAGARHRLVSGRMMYDFCQDLPAESNQKECFLTTNIEVTRESLNKEQRISISIPFAGAAFRDVRSLQNPLSFSKITKLGGGTSDYWLIQGAGFKSSYMSGIKFTAGEKTFTLDCGTPSCPDGVSAKPLGETAIQLTVPSKFLDSFKHVAITFKDSPTSFVLPMPPVPKVEPSVTTKAPEVALNSSSTVEFTGVSLDAVKKVMFAGKALPMVVSKDGTKLTVFLDTNVTGTPGTKSLAAMNDTGTLFALNMEVRSK